MRIEVVRCSKASSKETQIIVENYLKRINRYVDISLVDFRPSKRRNTCATNKKTLDTFMIGLDERGVQLSSNQLAESIRLQFDNPRVKKLQFVVGPPYGHDKGDFAQFDKVVSLSKLTLPSDLAWVLLVEQIYRALSILNGSPYHHE